MYQLEEKIIHFVFQVFQGMNRKKENIALASHSIMVGIMLKNIGCDESTVLAGYLHDIIEDTTFTYEDLKIKFGDEIATLVQKTTEDKTILKWRERKEALIERLQNENEQVLLIELADKLQNLISDYNLYRENGRESLNTEADGYDDIKWYYLTLGELFRRKLEENELLKRYNDITAIYFA